MGAILELVRVVAEFAVSYRDGNKVLTQSLTSIDLLTEGIECKVSQYFFPITVQKYNSHLGREVPSPQSCFLPRNG